MKLSKIQLEVLKELNKEGNFLHYLEYMGKFATDSYWFLDKSLKRVRCSTEIALHKNGLIVQYSIGGYNNLKAKITDKGRKFVNDLNRIN